MDIFEIAQQGMKIQEEEIREAAQEEEAKKPHKFDVKEAIEAASNKDYDWFNRLGEDQKIFQPFMMNMWMAQVWTLNNSRAFKGKDAYYVNTAVKVNSHMNANVFNTPKELFWLLSCSVQDYIKTAEDKNGNRRIVDRLEYTFNWVKKSERMTAEKYSPKVIAYMAQELFSSKDKIMDMIDNGLITAEDMKAIENDLDTLELKK